MFVTDHDPLKKESGSRSYLRTANQNSAPNRSLALILMIYQHYLKFKTNIDNLWKEMKKI
jgi:hypothetical protein